MEKKIYFFLNVYYNDKLNSHQYLIHFLINNSCVNIVSYCKPSDLSVTEYFDK